MPTTSSAPAPVARLRRPGEMAALVPLLCGFVPSESLVVVCLHGERSRVGLAMRVDLPAVEHEPELVDQMVARVLLDGATAAFVVLYTEDSSAALARSALIDDLEERLDDEDVALVDALLVRAGRWWSYLCDHPSCCPDDGTPVDGGTTPEVERVVAAQVLDGRAVLPTRDELVASLARPSGAEADALRARLRETDDTRAARLRAEGRIRVGQEALRLWRRVLSDLGEDRVPPGTAASLVVSLGDVLVRDEVLTWALEDDESLLALLLELARGAVPPFDAPVCTLVGWVAHVRGDGALANVALDRALDADAGYSLARLARQGLDSQVRPSQLRSLLTESRAMLHELHPWTACAARR
jgi:hypothetical protein